MVDKVWYSWCLKCNTEVGSDQSLHCPHPLKSTMPVSVAPVQVVKAAKKVDAPAPVKVAVEVSEQQSSEQVVQRVSQGRGRPRVIIPESAHADIVARYKGGERLTKIAASMKVSPKFITDILLAHKITPKRGRGVYIPT